MIGIDNESNWPATTNRRGKPTNRTCLGNGGGIIFQMAIATTIDIKTAPIATTRTASDLLFTLRVWPHAPAIAVDFSRIAGEDGAGGSGLTASGSVFSIF